MKLTKEQWKKLDKLSVKEKADIALETVYELVEDFRNYKIDQEQREFDKMQEEWDKNIDTIHDWRLFITWISVWAIIMVSIYFLFIK